MAEVRQQLTRYLAHAPAATAHHQQQQRAPPTCGFLLSLAVQAALTTSADPSQVYQLIFSTLGFRPIPPAACSCPGLTQPAFSPDPAAFQAKLAAMKGNAPPLPAV